MQVFFTVIAAVASIIALGALTAPAQGDTWQAFIERGVGLGTQVVGFTVAIGSLFKGANVLMRDDAPYRDVGATGLAAVAGGALVWVGTIALP
jgi:hypothetical protein